MALLRNCQWLILSDDRYGGFHVDESDTDGWFVVHETAVIGEPRLASGTFSPDTGACVVDEGIAALDDLERIADARRKARRAQTG
jgi:hypothetical protein